MKLDVLMIFHFAPYPPVSGVKRRMFHTFFETTKANNVSVLAFGSKDEERQFREQFGSLCKHIVFVDDSRPRAVSIILRLWFLLTGRSSLYRLHTKRFQEALDSLVQNEKFDVIHFATSIFGFYRLPPNVPLVGDTHNVEYHYMYRAYKETKSLPMKLYTWLEYMLIKREELNSTKKFDIVTTTSQQDLDTFRIDIPSKRMFVLPNGVDTEYFVPQQATPEPFSMVFTGLMNYLPNDHGVQYFAREILPLIRTRIADSRLYVVGAFPSKEVLQLASEHIIVTEQVPDVRPYFDRATVAVVPLLFGGGTRLKVLEAMAMKKPVVSTSLGCEGLDVEDGKSILIADTPEAFAQSVVSLFTDTALHSKIVENASRLAHDTYDWKSIGAHLQEILVEATNRTPRPQIGNRYGLKQVPEQQESI